MGSTPRIAILEPDVVNQIAAGEVVERPASVVKELCENALDAGASRIDVTVEQGGRRLVRVSDDGYGMTPEEARLSLKRHATSKLRAADDLLQIRTMGFRGEALPSIASISKLEIRTRTRESATGFRLTASGPDLGGGEPVGCRPGTTLEVSDLFFNTPARLKFLKSTATETGHISDVVTELALANPRVHFSLTVDGREVQELPSCAHRLERARQVLGRRGGPLAQGRDEKDGPQIAVELALGPPDLATRAARSIHLVVNRRVVRHRPLINAVVAGCESLEQGRFPLAVVHLELDPSLVDVNVHPQKVEVRFSDPERVTGAVRRCVRSTAIHGEWDVKAVYRLARQHPPGEDYGEHRARLEAAAKRFWSSVPNRARESREDYDAVEEPPGLFGGLRLLGQVMGTYVLCEGDDGLVIIDERAARERVAFERLRGGPVPSQVLLVPCEVELSPAQVSVASEHQEALADLGFELEPFGADRRAWMVRAAPVWLAGVDPGLLVRDVLDGLDLPREQLLAQMASHASKPHEFELDEARNLLAAMDSVGIPDGPPVVVRLGRSELERRLRR